MSLKMSILGLISYRGMSGYDINKLFDGSLKFFFNAQQSQIYRELATLKASGLVEEEQVVQENRPTKKLYQITDKGEQKLYDWLMKYDEENHFHQRLPYMSKVFFGEKIGDEELIKSLVRFKEFAIAKRDKLKRLAGNADAFIATYGVSKEEFFYWDLTIDYGISIYNMYINWADRCIEKLENRLK